MAVTNAFSHVGNCTLSLKLAKPYLLKQIGMYAREVRSSLLNIKYSLS